MPDGDLNINMRSNSIRLLNYSHYLQSVFHFHIQRSFGSDAKVLYFSPTVKTLNIRRVRLEQKVRTRTRLVRLLLRCSLVRTYTVYHSIFFNSSRCPNFGRFYGKSPFILVSSSEFYPFTFNVISTCPHHECPVDSELFNMPYHFTVMHMTINWSCPYRE